MVHENFAKEWEKIPKIIKTIKNSNYDIYVGANIKVIQQNIRNAWK